MNARPRLSLAGDPPELLEKRRRDAARMRAWRAKHPEAVEYQREYARRNRDKKSHAYYVRKFGISLDAVRVLLETQGGVCAICRVTLSSERKPRGHQGTVLNVDHDHVSGAVRGILCHYCNAGLGYFRDQRTTLAAAIEYLSQHERK